MIAVLMRLLEIEYLVINRVMSSVHNFIWEIYMLFAIKERYILHAHIRFNGRSFSILTECS